MVEGRRGEFLSPPTVAAAALTRVWDFDEKKWRVISAYIVERVFILHIYKHALAFFGD